MDTFVVKDLRDISFPYSAKILLEDLNNSFSRFKFLKLQNPVLSIVAQVANLEKDIKRHRRFFI